MPISPGIAVNVDLTGTVSTSENPINLNSKFGTMRVLNVATKINATGTDLVGRKTVTIQNNSLNGIYIAGDNLVTKETGIYLASGSSMNLNLDPSLAVEIWGISTGIPALISVLEV